MKRLLKRLTCISLILTIISVIIYNRLSMGLFFSLTLTFATTFYHFAMRLAVGGIIDYIMDNQADYHKKWYQPLAFEKILYKKLKVRQWKNKMPTYDPDQFSIEDKSFDAIAQAMCQAEIVHEVIILFSFLPIFASYWLGALPVFVITSIVSAAFDLMFVMMQRFNRPRIIKLAEREKRNKIKFSVTDERI